jgi:CRISPR system Cascade subunit CasC
MLIEIHLLQNHAPSNLNRDDTGSPKECVFGGVRRARISSQCLKRSIRRGDIFQEALEGHLGTRTRQLPELVKQAFEKDETLAAYAETAAKKATGFGTKKGDERKAETNGKYLTAQTMFLTQADVDAVVASLKAAAKDAKTEKAFAALEAKKLQADAQAKGFRPVSVDVALFGRMVTSEAFRDVEASCQVAHALSTHRVEQEFDYFTAVDDLQGISEGEGEEDSGADMIGDVEFNSACYYKYFSVDVDGLVDNLVGRNLRRDISEAEEAEARDLACRAVAALIEGAAMTTPTGKQNTFAAHQLPAAILVEVRPVKTPVSYTNAFVEPVRAFSKTDGDLVSGSLSAFAQHVDALTRGFNLRSTARYVLAPLHSGYAIKGVETVPDLTTLLERIREACHG